MNQYIAGFIEAFFLVLTVGCTVIPGAAGVIPPLAVGAVLMVMILASSHISGGAFNPAVAARAAVMKLVHVSDSWIHLVAGLPGGLCARRAFKALDPGDT